jgi:hypothetical protein
MDRTYKFIKFHKKFYELVHNTAISNDDRATSVEDFILQEAVLAGVVKKYTISTPRNPNKWGKTLAPWFTEDCRAAKREM